jgi:hypothetical protein
VLGCRARENNNNKNNNTILVNYSSELTVRGPVTETAQIAITKRTKDNKQNTYDETNDQSNRRKCNSIEYHIIINGY